jgi:hypothetical protein
MTKAVVSEGNFKLAHHREWEWLSLLVGYDSLAGWTFLQSIALRDSWSGWASIRKRGSRCGAVLVEYPPESR